MYRQIRVGECSFFKTKKDLTNIKRIALSLFLIDCIISNDTPLLFELFNASSFTSYELVYSKLKQKKINRKEQNQMQYAKYYIVHSTFDNKI